LEVLSLVVMREARAHMFAVELERRREGESRIQATRSAGAAVAERAAADPKSESFTLL
jgi:hypothetical protein